MNYEKFERILTAVYAEYLQLEQQKKAGACERTLALLSSMLRKKDGRKQKLAELGKAGKAKQSDAARTRSTLVRKTNASSPKAAIKPVKTTKKNELRKD